MDGWVVVVGRRRSVVKRREKDRASWKYPFMHTQPLVPSPFASPYSAYAPHVGMGSIQRINLRTYLPGHDGSRRRRVGANGDILAPTVNDVPPVEARDGGWCGAVRPLQPRSLRASRGRGKASVTHAHTWVF